MSYLRQRNTDRTGRNFSPLEKILVWQKAIIIPGKDMRFWRQDSCGAYIYWNDYGNTNSIWGWEIDHITPVAHQGSDSIGNLQALQWENNRNKSDSLSANYCAVTFRN